MRDWLGKIKTSELLGLLNSSDRAWHHKTREKDVCYPHLALLRSITRPSIGSVLLHLKNTIFTISWTSEMAQWVKTLDVRPDNLSSISGFHTGKGGNQALTFVLWPLHVCCGIYTTEKNVIFKKFKMLIALIKYTQTITTILALSFPLPFFLRESEATRT